ncbi:hypothetical protein LY76DRAFT_634629 [Colletotrichum caudatum]|nr:hypothetical protein LY76DRAFT_634629 [Colletotrichum caudatum]
MFLRASCILFVVAHFAVLAASKSFSAAYEKIWLYYAYQVAFKIEGPSQPYILRQLDPNDPLDRKYTTAINNGNRGSLKDGMMTWNEFQWALNNLKGKPDLPQLEDDIEKTATNIWYSTIRNKMMVDVAATNWDKKKPAKYETYIDSLAAMIRKVRNNSQNDYKIQGELKKLQKISEKIVSVRQAEFRQDKYLGEELKELFPGVILHTDPVSDPGNPSKTFNVVNLPETLRDPESEIAIRAAVGGESDTTNLWKKKFVQFVFHYGETRFDDDMSDDNPFKGTNPFTKPARQHRAALDVWENCLDATERIIC